MEKLLEQEKITTEAFNKLQSELSQIETVMKEKTQELLRLQGEYRVIQTLKKDLSETK